MSLFGRVYAERRMFSDAGFGTADRSQVGIGTLIVFIAMVLVAAIGAGVLLNTAGLLQSKSQQTSQQAQAGVTDRFQITGVVGNVVNKTCAGAGEITVEGTGDEDSCIRVESGEPILVNEPENDLSGPAPGLIFGDVSTGKIDRYETISLSVSRPADPDRWPSVSLYKGGAARENEEVIAYDIGLPVGIDAEDDAFNYLTDKDAGTIAIVNAYGGESVRFSRPDDMIDTIAITVRQAPGSDPIDLADATVTYQSATQVTTLTYSPQAANNTRFTAQPLTGDDVVLKEGEQAQIIVDAWYLENGLDTALASDDGATITVTGRAGTTVRTDIRVPQITNQDAVRLAR